MMQKWSKHQSPSAPWCYFDEVEEAIRAAVQKEREEIISEIQCWRNKQSDLRTLDGLMTSFRSRGAVPEKPGKIERLPLTQSDSDIPWWLVVNQRINELIDAVNALREK